MSTTSGSSGVPDERHEREGTPPGTGPVFDLASWTREVREDCGLTRPRSAEVTGISEYYLKDIENDGVIPSPIFLDSLIKGYRMDEAQALLTRDLCRPASALPSVRELRERVSTPARRELLNRLDVSGIALAYLDPAWNILISNSSWFEFFPGAGIGTAGNVALWSLPPAPEPSPIEPLLVHPGPETRWFVGTLRAAIARYRDSPRMASLYQQLSRNRVFDQHWGELHVAYGRSDKQPLHLRHPATQRPYTLTLQLTQLTDLPEIRGFLAWPQPTPH